MFELFASRACSKDIFLNFYVRYLVSVFNEFVVDLGRELALVLASVADRFPYFTS